MNHEKYIQRCIQLAANGLGTTGSNPMVGSVLVHNNVIIGEGWHYKAGLPHAEVNAINSVKNKSLLKEATIYVSLEPCSHFGKTPPCSDLIVDSGIKKVVVGTIDPFSEVAGRGIEKLRNAGCEVMVGVLEEACQALNKRFFTFHTKKRPYIFLKWAETADGFIAPEYSKEAKREPVWITDQFSKQLVHKQRSIEQAILVGTETVIKDNPSLNTRFWKGEDPLRVVLDLKNRIPTDSKIFKDNKPTLVLTFKEKENTKTVIYETINREKPIVENICKILYKYEIQSVIVEGGKKTLETFIEANRWDEAFVYSGDTVFFNKGIQAPKLEKDGRILKNKTKDILTHYIND